MQETIDEHSILHHLLTIQLLAVIGHAASDDATESVRASQLGRTDALCRFHTPCWSHYDVLQACLRVCQFVAT